MAPPSTYVVAAADEALGTALAAYRTSCPAPRLRTSRSSAELVVFLASTLPLCRLDKPLALRIIPAAPGDARRSVVF